MVSESVKNSIKEAKEALDQAETLGETAFDICDGKLSNIKALVHDEKVMNEITEKEKNVFETYRKKWGDARNKLKNIDPMYAWKEGLEYTMQLRKWKSMELLNFMDNITKAHDL